MPPSFGRKRCPSCKEGTTPWGADCTVCQGTGWWEEPTPPADPTIDSVLFGRPSIQQRFDAWIITPDGIAVYQNILARAKRLWDRGFRHFGIKALWEAARYDRALEVGPDADGYKLCNDYHSRMARYIMERNPYLDGFFTLRELTA